MKNTLLHCRRLLGAAALVGVVFSSQAASAQSMLDSSEAEAFLGNWVISLDTDFGSFDMDLKVEDQEGKVAVSIGIPEQGMADVTDITKSGENLVLDYEVDGQGQMFQVSVILELDSEGLSATFDFGGQFTAVGSGTRVDG